MNPAAMVSCEISVANSDKWFGIRISDHDENNQSKLIFNDQAAEEFPLF